LVTPTGFKPVTF